MDVWEEVLRGRISLFISTSITTISERGKLSKMLLLEKCITRAPIRSTHTSEDMPCFQNNLFTQAGDYMSCVLKHLSSADSLFCLIANDCFNKGFVFHDSVLQVSNISGALKVKYTCRVSQALENASQAGLKLWGLTCFSIPLPCWTVHGTNFSLRVAGPWSYEIKWDPVVGKSWKLCLQTSLRKLTRMKMLQIE